MQSNVVYMIGDKMDGRIFDFKNMCFTKDAGFDSFLPAKGIANDYCRRHLGDTNSEYFVIVEAEIMRYDGMELIISYDRFVS